MDADRNVRRRPAAHLRLAALALACAVTAGADVTVDVAPDLPTATEPFELLLLSHDAAAVLTQRPRLSGLTWLDDGQGRTSREADTTGGTAGRFVTRYRLRAATPGAYRLPTLQVREGTRIVRTRPLQIQVTERAAVSMVLSYDGKPEPPPYIYLGQVLDVVVRVYVDRRLRLHEDTLRKHFFPDVVAHNIVFRDYSAQNPYNSKCLYDISEVVIDGRPQRLFTYTFSVSAMRAGEMTARFAHELPVLRRPAGGVGRSHDPFDSVAGRDPLEAFITGAPTTIRRRRLEVELPAIAVRALPPPPKEAGLFYLGLIGDWRVKATLDATTIAVGEGVNLRVVVEGRGNLEGLIVPPLRIAGFQVYQPEVDKQLKAPITGTISWLLVAKKPAAAFPPLTLTTFDAAAGVYRRHAFRPPLEVRAGEAALAPPGPLVVNTGTGRDPLGERRRRRLPEILYVKSGPGVYLTRPLWRRMVLPVAGGGLAGPLLFLAAAAVARRRERLVGSEKQRRRCQALRRRKAVFRALRTASPDGLAAVVRGELVPYLRDLKGLPPGASIAELADGIDDAVLADVLRRAETAAFMPGASGALDAATVLRRAKAVTGIALLCLATAVVAANDNAAVFRSAAAAYDAQHPAAAERLYTSLERQGTENSTLLYNVGNCRYKQGDAGGAIRCYERARRLAPRDADIVENLNFVRGQLGLGPVDTVDSPAAVLRRGRDLLRPDEWLLVAVTAWVAFWGSCAAYRMRGAHRPPALFALLVGAAIAIGAVVWQMRSTYAPGQAVIVAADAGLFPLPGQADSAPAATLALGDYVRVRERRGAWTRVRIDEAEGWVRNVALSCYWD